MQPYFYPYIGYFQLINAVDKFILLDDVNYIKRGWVNRNKINVDNKESLFVVPLEKPSQNKLIKDTYLKDDKKCKDKILKTIEFSYKKSPYFTDCFSIVKKSILNEEKNLSLFILESIKDVCNYLDIKTEIEPSSSVYLNSHLKSSKKIIDICIQEKATKYINPIGGIELYSKDDFKNHGIELSFLKTKDIIYKQFGSEFIPYLSVIDLMMFNSPSEIRKMLEGYDLI